jgi:hypothetical protein
MPKWFRTGDDVTFDDESKVREWGGVAVDVMHVSALVYLKQSQLIPDLGSWPPTRCQLCYPIPIGANAPIKDPLLEPIYLGSTISCLPPRRPRPTISYTNRKSRPTPSRPTTP